MVLYQLDHPKISKSLISPSSGRFPEEIFNNSMSIPKPLPTDLPNVGKLYTAKKSFYGRSFNNKITDPVWLIQSNDVILPIKNWYHWYPQTDFNLILDCLWVNPIQVSSPKVVRISFKFDESRIENWKRWLEELK